MKKFVSAIRRFSIKAKLLFFFIFLFLHAKAQTFQWAKAGNTNGVNKMVKDKAGYLYVAGDQFVAKYDSVANFIWLQNINGNGSITGIAVDSIGNLYASGPFVGIITIGSYSVTSDSGDMFLTKFNSGGTAQWISRSHSYFQFGGGAFPDGITIDKQGYPIIIGRFLEYLRLDSFVFHAPQTNQIFLAKYSPTGNCMWAKHLESWSFDGGGNGPKIKSDELGNTFISGHFINHGTFDNITINAHSAYDDDIFLAKINSFGNFLWAKDIGGSDQEISGPMDVDSYGNTYMTGYFASPVIQFGNNTLTTSSYNYFTAKYDKDGNCQWGKYGSAGTICAMNNGYYTNNPQFINRYDDYGTLLWTKNVTGVNNYAMAKGQSAVYITGKDSGSVYFDTCNLNCPNWQMYIAKLGDPISTLAVNEIEDDSSLSVYPNPTAGIFQINYSASTKSKRQLNIIDEKGKNVYSESFNGNYNKSIDLGDRANGIYFIEIISEDKKKIVKKIVLN